MKKFIKLFEEFTSTPSIQGNYKYAEEKPKAVTFKQRGYINDELNIYLNGEKVGHITANAQQGNKKRYLAYINNVNRTDGKLYGKFLNINDAKEDLVENLEKWLKDVESKQKDLWSKGILDYVENSDHYIFLCYKGQEILVGMPYGIEKIKKEDLEDFLEMDGYENEYELVTLNKKMFDLVTAEIYKN